jgi:hypothetical protein
MHKATKKNQDMVCQNYEHEMLQEMMLSMWWLKEHHLMLSSKPT